MCFPVSVIAICNLYIKDYGTKALLTAPHPPHSFGTHIKTKKEFVGGSNSPITSTVGSEYKVQLRRRE